MFRRRLLLCFLLFFVHCDRLVALSAGTSNSLTTSTVLGVPTQTSSRNITDPPDPPVDCQARLGQRLHIRDCRYARALMADRDPDHHLAYATFSDDRRIATPSEGDVYLTPQLIKVGDCEVLIELNGNIDRAYAMWIDAWDGASRILEKCTEHYGFGGRTTAPNIGRGLKITMGRKLPRAKGQQILPTVAVEFN